MKLSISLFIAGALVGASGCAASQHSQQAASPASQCEASGAGPGAAASGTMGPGMMQKGGMKAGGMGKDGMMGGGGMGKGGMMAGGMGKDGMMGGGMGKGGMMGMADCPMAVPGTTVRAEEVEGGSAIVFATTGDVAELRRRVAAMAEMHNKHQGTGCPMMAMHDGADAAPSGTAVAPPVQQAPKPSTAGKAAH